MARFRSEVGIPRREQHLRLEDEAVANDPDIRPIAQDLAQPPEELRAIARELLHLARERCVEALAEIGDLHLLVLGLLLGDIQRGREPRELLAKRRDLLVQQAHQVLRGAQRRFLLAHRSVLVLELVLSARSALVDPGGQVGDIRLHLIACRDRRLQLARGLREADAQVVSVLLDEVELAREIRDLLAELAQPRLAAGERAGQIELRGREDHHHEDDNDQQLRERIDEAWPDVDADASLTATRKGHGSAPIRFLGERRDGAREEADLVADFLHRRATALRDILIKPRQVQLDIAHVSSGLLVRRRALRAVGEALQHGLKVVLAVGELRQQALLGAHVIG